MMMKSSKFLSCRDRNNSANIAAILQPDYYQKQSLETITTTTLRENTNETCNFCYCRKLSDDDNDDKPKLFQHPLECCQNDHQQHHYKYCSDYADDDDDDGSPRRSFNLRQDFIQRDFIDRSCNNHKFDDDKQNLNDLESWRQSHYFETHSVDDLLKKQNNTPCCCQQQQQQHHTCIHQFKLNERNLPVAINMDQYGLSRCIICNRPMKNVRISCNNDGDKNPIYLDDDDNIKIQLILNNDDDKQDLVHPSTINYWNNQLKRPVYSNTLALRYQKGVAWP